MGGRLLTDLLVFRCALCRAGVARPDYDHWHRSRGHES
jgi:hypothetical protein